MKRVLASACCLAAFALTCACSSTDEPISLQTPQNIPPPPSSSTAAATTPASNLNSLPAASAAKAAYVQMWADGLDASQTRNEHLLGHHADGAALTKLRQSYSDALTKHYEVRGSVQTKPTVVSVFPSLQPVDVHLTDCWSEGNETLVDYSTKKPIGIGSKTGYPITSEVRLEHGVWKVMSYDNVTGAPACTPA